MKVRFPFKVKQTSPSEVEVLFDHEGRPILEWTIHDAVREAIGDVELDALYIKTLGAIVRASVKVE